MHLQSLSPRAFLAGAVSLVIIIVFLLVSFGTSDETAPRLGDSLRRTKSVDDIENHVFNETLGFQKIFVINLPSRPDHRDSMSLAASLTGLKVDYVDGVTEVEHKILPSGAEKANLGDGALGAWRAHMNVARRIIEQNITSALVLEGDVDWDLRIKEQMQTFAKATRLLLQPGNEDRIFDVANDVAPKSATSPYGNIELWDVLWIGHCGSRLPSNDDTKVPRGRAVIPNDETVPEAQHLDFEFGGKNLIEDYPDHTRVVSWSRANVCTLAYGMSQAGARRFLYQLGIRKLNSSTDLMFQQMCDGTHDRPRHKCLTVQPQLFQHHRAVGLKSAFSGISDHGTGYNKIAFSKNVRWSTRLNFENLVYGRTDFIDLFGDGQAAAKLEES